MLRALIFFSLSLPLVSSAADPQASIRATIAAYVNARNEKSPDRLRTLFTPDADQLVSTGEWRRGPAELLRGMSASSQHERSRSISITSIRLLDPDIALVDGRYQTTLQDGTVRDMWTTFLLRRTSGQWLIAAIRNMKPAPSSPPSPAR